MMGFRPDPGGSGRPPRGVGSKLEAGGSKTEAGGFDPPGKSDPAQPHLKNKQKHAASTPHFKFVNSIAAWSIMSSNSNCLLGLSNYRGWAGRLNRVRL